MKLIIYRIFWYADLVDEFSGIRATLMPPRKTITDHAAMGYTS